MRQVKGKRHKRTVRKRGQSHLISKRYCLKCNRSTKFRYNRNIGHSECTICGWRFVGGDVA